MGWYGSVKVNLARLSLPLEPRTEFTKLSGKEGAP
jgi:hypothetical protein